jgi:hypothetical protein
VKIFWRSKDGALNFTAQIIEERRWNGNYGINFPRTDMPILILSSFGGTHFCHLQQITAIPQLQLAPRISQSLPQKVLIPVLFLTNPPRTLYSSTTITNVPDTIPNLHHNNLLPLPHNLSNSTPIPLLPPTFRPLLRRCQNNTAPKNLNQTRNTESDIQGREGDGFRFGEGWDSGSAGGSTEAWEGLGEERGIEWIVGRRCICWAAVRFLLALEQLVDWVS